MLNWLWQVWILEILPQNGSNESLGMISIDGWAYIFYAALLNPQQGKIPFDINYETQIVTFHLFFLELQKVQHSSFKFGEAVKTNVHAANYLVGTFILLIDFVLRLLVPKAFLEWIQWIHRHPLSLVPSVIISTLWLSREMFHKKKFKKCIFKIDRKRE